MFDIDLLRYLHDDIGFGFGLANDRRPLSTNIFSRSGNSYLNDEYDQISRSLNSGNFSGHIAGLIPYDYAVLDIDCYKDAEILSDQVNSILNNCWVGEDVPLVVNTPSGGYHLYARLPSTVSYCDLSTSPVEANTGLSTLELKKFGTCVHLPGNSRSGASYSVLKGNKSDLSKIFFTESFLSLFRKGAKPKKSANSYPAISVDELGKLLAGLDARDFRDYPTWRSLLFSAHSATNGAGEAVFKAWSGSDSKYSNEKDQADVSLMWAACRLSDEGTNFVTLGTLLHHYRRYHAQLPFELKPSQKNKLLLNKDSGLSVVDSLDRHPKTGKIINSQYNREMIFTQDEVISKMFCYDDFKNIPLYRPGGDGSFETFTIDEHIYSVRTLVRNRYCDLKNLSLSQVMDEVNNRIYDNRFNSLQKDLDLLSWDGVKRIDNWLSVYCGVEDSPYSRDLSRFTLLAAAKRAYFPGCIYPNVLILKGPQGIGKSALVEILAGGADRYYSMSTDFDAVKVNMRGKWFLEMGELNALNKAQIEQVKDFVSVATDHYRMPYARQGKAFPRYQIIIGTTNDDEFLKDPTGERRFWPVHCRDIDLDRLKLDRDQLIAEAVHLVKGGVDTSFSFSKEALDESLAIKRSFSRTGIFYDDLLLAFADGGPLATFYKSNNNSIRTSEILTGMGLENKRGDRRTSLSIGSSMRYLGFAYTTIYRSGKRVKGWVNQADILEK
jgi:hypothetical protein